MLSFCNEFSLKESNQEKSTRAAVTFNLKCLSDRLTLCHLLHFFFFKIFLRLPLEKCKIDWKSRDSLCLQSLPVGARWTTAWETSRTWLPVARGAFVTSGLPMQWRKNQTRRAPTERGTWPHSSAAKKSGKKPKTTSWAACVTRIASLFWQRVNRRSSSSPSSFLSVMVPVFTVCAHVFYRPSGFLGSTYSNPQICSFNQGVTPVPSPSPTYKPEINCRSTQVVPWFWPLLLSVEGFLPHLQKHKAQMNVFSWNCCLYYTFSPSGWVVFILCPSVATSNGKIKHHKSSQARDAFQAEG